MFLPGLLDGLAVGFIPGFSICTRLEWMSGFLLFFLHVTKVENGVFHLNLYDGFRTCPETWTLWRDRDWSGVGEIGTVIETSSFGRASPNGGAWHDG